VRTPDIVALSELDDGTTLLVHEGLRASGLDTADADRLSDVVLRDLWTQVALLHRARQASRDDGVDAVAVNEDPFMGGHCIIQAKHYRSAVGVEPMRALAGVMDDKHASGSSNARRSNTCARNTGSRRPD
jgi:hypothetical protein